jgi:hypothetical protein
MKTLARNDAAVYSVAALCLIATVLFLAVGKNRQATVVCSIGGLLSVFWGYRRRRALGPNA